MLIIFQTNSLLKIQTSHLAAQNLYQPHFRGDFRGDFPGVFLSALLLKSSKIRDFDDNPEHIALDHIWLTRFTVYRFTVEEIKIEVARIL